MRFDKLNGILAEVAKLYPNIDIANFLSQELDLTIDKAEILAARIEKKFRQQNKPQNTVKMLLEKNDTATSLDEAVYLVEYLSENEFAYFVRWLLEELEYEVSPEKYVADFGADLLAAKDGEKFVFLARRYPKMFKIANTIILMAQEAKYVYDCERIVVLTTTFFTPQTVAEVQRLNIALWDADILACKIAEVKNKVCKKEKMQFPQYARSLLQSLQQLVETKLFIIEPRAGEKYDLFVPWIKYPLLTYQINSGDVTRCVYRIKYNHPVAEREGETLICIDRSGNRLGPNDEQAYTAILLYLNHFME